MRPTLIGLCALALVRGAAPAAAQGSLVHHVGGDGPAHRLGTAVAEVGDIDGDGSADFALGAPFDPVGSVQTGSVRVHSGATGQLLQRFDGDGALDHAGAALAGLGDVDGDGVGDLAVGIPRSDFPWADAGLVRVFSGRTGATLYSITTNAPGEELGASVARCPDSNGDGVAELAVGVLRADDGGTDSGRVELRSGANGGLLWSAPGLAPGEQLGRAVASIGDVDGDGTPDVLAGGDEAGVGAGGRGVVRVLSGRTGRVVSTLVGAAPGDHFGRAVAGLDDVDGDGVPDLAVGAPDAAVQGARRGRTTCHSGATGALLRAFDGVDAGEAAGSALACAADLDGDGVRELLIGAPFAVGPFGPDGHVEVRSPVTGELLRRHRGVSPAGRFGAACAALADLDGDGVEEVLVGAPGEDGVAVDAGAGRVLAGGDCAPRAYCSAKVNALGCTPVIGWSGRPTESGPDDFRVRATGVTSGRGGLLFFGSAPNDRAFFGGRLCVRPPLVRCPIQGSGGSAPSADCSGTFDQHLSQARLQALGLTAGADLFAQYWSLDPTHADGTGVGLTDALAVTVCP